MESFNLLSAGEDQDVDEGVFEKTTEHRRVVISTKHALPDKSYGIEIHFKIIKAYVVVSNEGRKAVSYKDFKDVVDFYYGAVSSNHKFFKELGLIEQIKPKGMFLPTKNAIEFNRYNKWGQEEKALDILKELIKDSWFWQSTKQILLMRDKGVQEREILNKLGTDSKADPERHMGSLKILIKYLEYVRLIKIDEKTNRISAFEPQQSSVIEEITEEEHKNSIHQTGDNEEKLSPLIVQNNTDEVTHYREESGHFTLKIKLDNISIQLLEEEIKYVKQKYNLLHNKNEINYVSK